MPSMLLGAWMLYPQRLWNLSQSWDETRKRLDPVTATPFGRMDLLKRGHTTGTVKVLTCFGLSPKNQGEKRLDDGYRQRLRVQPNR